MGLPEHEILRITRQWVEDFVVRHNLCPFAAPILKNNGLRLICDPCGSAVEARSKMSEECMSLSQQPYADPLTTLIVYPNLGDDFHKYLDFADELQVYLESDGLIGIIQLATFHPNYCFENSMEEDLANYTNRSPWPMLHLIREADVSRAVESYRKAEGIPMRNIQYLRSMGAPKLRTLLEPFLGKHYLP